MFYDNLKAACTLRKTTVTAALKKIGVSGGSGTNWKKGGTPSLDILVQLSEFLDVPIDYLVFGKRPTVSMLSDDEQELVNTYRILSQMDKGRVLQKAEDLAEAAHAASKADVS